MKKPVSIPKARAERIVRRKFLVLEKGAKHWSVKEMAVAVPAGVPQLANEGTEPMIGFVNEIQIQEDGWAQLAPLGDAFNTAVVVKADGTINKFTAIQRMDSQAVAELVNSFKSSTTKRYLTGIPIYDGHPDMPGMGSRYPDKTPKGIIADLQAREDGLWGKPVFTNEGLALVESKKRKAFSARWTSTDAGKAEDGKPILRPSVLVSAGLTNNPNLPVKHLMNAEWQDEPNLNDSNITMKKSVIEFLVAMGVQLSNDASEEQITSGLKTVQEKHKQAATLANEKDTAVTELANEKTAHQTTKSTLETRTNELATVRTELANEKSGRIEALLDLAIKDGRITAAQREEWKNKLVANLANEAEALKKVTPILKTGAKTGEAGDRKAELANAVDRREQVRNLVQAEMVNSKCDYDTAYSRVEKKNPALFEQMQRPALSIRPS